MERIERVRLIVGERKGDFALSLGMHPPNYSKLLRGETFLTADQLYALWQLYGADPAYIMAGREDGPTATLRDRLRAARGEGR